MWWVVLAWQWDPINALNEKSKLVWCCQLINEDHITTNCMVFLLSHTRQEHLGPREGNVQWLLSYDINTCICNRYVYVYIYHNSRKRFCNSENWKLKNLSALKKNCGIVLLPLPHPEKTHNILNNTSLIFGYRIDFVITGRKFSCWQCVK